MKIVSYHIVQGQGHFPPKMKCGLCEVEWSGGNVDGGARMAQQRRARPGQVKGRAGSWLMLTDND